ncbi:MAG: zinc ribbon domain-containing protein YjdM [Erysipelotrichaceae bacterium]
MEKNPNCPQCKGEYVYEDQGVFVCPECFHEWSQTEVKNPQEILIKDVNGNILQDGDSVSVVKDLKVKGSSSTIKIGTKVKNIRLVKDSNDDHDIDCRIDGFGAMKLKSSVVKKV